MKKLSFLFALTLCALPAAAAAPAKKPSVESLLTTLHSVQEYGHVAISPDGKRLAWVKKIKDRKGAWKLAAVEVAEVGSSAAPARVTAAADGRAHDERDPVWSPDGKQIAFLSDGAKDGQAQVWLAPASGGAARRLTTVKGQLADPRWAPDGKAGAFLYVGGR